MNGVPRFFWFFIQRIFLGCVLLLGSECLTTSADAAATFFSFSSSPSAWVGGGKTTNLTSVGASHTGSLGVYTDSVHLTAGGYELVIVGPALSTPQVGFYANATRWPFMGSGPGLAFSSPGRGDNTLSGWFNVLQADYDVGGQPTAFAVDFVQYDETNTNAWNRGSVRFNSDVPAPGPTPTPQISGLLLTNGVVKFTVTGAATTNCIVQISTNLLTWSPLMTNAISPVGLLAISNAPALADDRRFYRIVYATNAAGGSGSNDQFANRTTIPSTGGFFTGSNVGATKEAGEPDHGGATGGKSVWWTWTAPASGIVSITTDGSSFDTTLGVYTGTTVSALTSIAQDDEGGVGSCSRVVFTASAGVTYQIAVDGYFGASGNISLALKQGLFNDAFATRLLLSGPSDYVVGSNVGATRETNEPYHYSSTGGQSVWWQWQAPLSGTVTISTANSTFDTILAAYTGSSLSTLSLVANNDDYGGFATSQISFVATAGTVYQIAVDGYASSSGGIILAVQQ
ncbi:MAG: hypothetical protein JWO95_1555 [Verrucomicrobiales bacterium]|nr:hypothetical protein [Verrucomicrobiales bacterium]